MGRKKLIDRERKERAGLQCTALRGHCRRRYEMATRFTREVLKGTTKNPANDWRWRLRYAEELA